MKQTQTLKTLSLVQRRLSEGRADVSDPHHDRLHSTVDYSRRIGKWPRDGDMFRKYN